MITAKQLVPFQKKVSVLAQDVEKLEILSVEDMRKATIILSNMNKYADSVKEKKEMLTKPINESLKAIRFMFKPLEEVYEEAIDLLRRKMITYQTAEVARVKDEENKIASRVAPGKGNISIETAVKRIDQIKTPEKEVATDAGLVQFREVKKFRVMDITLLPIEYHLANEKLITQAMKEGKELPGIEYYSEQVPVNYR